MAEFSVDARGMDELITKLRHAAVQGRHEVDKTLLILGEELKETAKEIAGEHSATIPPTIHMQPLGAGAVRLTAGSERVPLAALYELGNKGGKRNSPTFRHPVFGNKNVWVEQPRYRFFNPARLRLRKRDMERLTKAWEQAMRNAGLTVRL